MLIDTHAHLDGTDYAPDLPDVIARASAAGVAAIVCVSQNEQSSRASLQLAKGFSCIAPAIGVHPHEAKSAGKLDWLESLVRDEAVIAVGEIGLDYHYNFSSRESQREAFVRQLDIAARSGLPVIVHCREAEDDVAALLSKHFAHRDLALLHCFMGSYDVGQSFINQLGAYLGIGGALTFKNVHALHDAAARLPLERLVLETDCPYMTPAPHRGRRNEPSYITYTCRRFAELRGQSEQHIGDATCANAVRLFPKVARLVGDARNGIGRI